MLFFFKRDMKDSVLIGSGIEFTVSDGECVGSIWYFWCNLLRFTVRMQLIDPSITDTVNFVVIGDESVDDGTYASAIGYDVPVFAIP